MNVPFLKSLILKDRVDGVVFESVPRENQSVTVSNRQMPIWNCDGLILMGDPSWNSPGLFETVPPADRIMVQL